MQSIGGMVKASLHANHAPRRTAALPGLHSSISHTFQGEPSAAPRTSHTEFLVESGVEILQRVSLDMCSVASHITSAGHSDTTTFHHFLPYETFEVVGWTF
eukprot:5852484-Amphidinium_carterae.1